MSLRHYLSIYNRENGGLYHDMQILGNHSSFSKMQYAAMGIEPDEEGCFEETEVDYHALINALKGYYIEALTDVFNNQSYEEYKEYILDPNGTFLRSPDWSLSGAYPFLIGQLDLLINGLDYGNRKNTFKITLKAS